MGAFLIGLVLGAAAMYFYTRQQAKKERKRVEAKLAELYHQIDRLEGPDIETLRAGPGGPP